MVKKKKKKKTCISCIQQETYPESILKILQLNNKKAIQFLNGKMI